MRQRLRAVTLMGLFAMFSTLGCSDKSNSVKAADLYQRACAGCHGARGTGGLPVEDGAPVPRDFTDVAWQRSRTDEELVRTITGGRGPMPSFRFVLTPSEIEAVVQQVRGFGNGGTAAGGS